MFLFDSRPIKLNMFELVRTRFLTPTGARAIRAAALPGTVSFRPLSWASSFSPNCSR